MILMNKHRIILISRYNIIWMDLNLEKVKYILKIYNWYINFYYLKVIL